MESKFNITNKIVCTSEITGNTFAKQFWYWCKTCYPKDNQKGCCASCALKCHGSDNPNNSDNPKDSDNKHDLVLHYSNYFCDCYKSEKCFLKND